ncbi:MAG TPA: DUF2251 domain-containing protein [Planctomycetaceae bacterium]|jgi:hypothetical protein|nr:DUF2251 domain-containing protein [Planctomycetaceae bacterium]
MSANLVAEETITVGQPVVVEGPAPNTSYGAVFEDDGKAGYFYGLDFSQQEQPILDARHIYNVEQVTDRSKPSVVQIAWSADGLKAGLFINTYPHAVIDFAARRSYCRTGFPRPIGNWSEHNAAWDDRAVELLR